MLPTKLHKSSSKKSYLREMTAVKDELSELKTLVKEQYLTQKLNQLVPPAYTSSYNEKIYSATPKPTKQHINLQSSRQFNSYAT
jgi:hypothetical protein